MHKWLLRVIASLVVLVALTPTHVAAQIWSRQTVDGALDTGDYNSLALDADDNPCISYYDVTNADLKFARWNGSAWAKETVDSTGNVGRYTSLKLDALQRPCISYYDVTNNDLKFARWNGSSWTIQTVDSTGSVGTYTSLALDGAGNPCISYRDYTNSRSNTPAGTAVHGPYRSSTVRPAAMGRRQLHSIQPAIRG